MTDGDENNSRSGALKPLAQLVPYLRNYKTQIALALLFLVSAAVTTLSLPLAVRRVIDQGFTAANSSLVNSYFSVLILIAVLLAVSSAGRYYFVIWLGERVVADLRKDVFANVTRLSASFFDTAHSGEIISRLTADTTQIKSAVGATASMALRNSILGIGAMIMMIYTSPKLSLFVIGAIPLILVPMITFGRAVRKRSRAAQDTLATATAYASESIGAVQTMQAYTNEKNVNSGYSNAVDFAFDAARLATRTRAWLTALAFFLILSSVIAVLWIGASNVLDGTMSAGTLSQFLLYAVFAAGAFGSLSEVWGELTQAAGSAERLVELLGKSPDVPTPANAKDLPEDVKGNIEFSAVGFSYPTRPDTKALDDVSVNIKSGETVAIVGSSGSGKTTFFNLLLRFYDPQTGSIKLDGLNLTDLDPEALRKQFALVPQETAIFAASVEDNIAYGSGEHTEKQIREAAIAANAHEFIEKLDKGYDTVLGERGVTLSGGQRQRLSLARAILRDAPILLLDEATSALDAESERLVQDALERLMKDRTTLVIAHRLATVKQADRILVMEAGKIVEEGSHKSLVAKKGIYAGLAKLQFSDG